MAEEEVDKPTGDTQLLEDPRRALVDRIAASESFKRSPRLRKLLIYLGEYALRDEQSPLTEQRLASPSSIACADTTPAPIL